MIRTLVKAGLAGIFAVMGYAGVAPWGKSPHIWYFAAVFCASWALSSATRSWLVQRIAGVIALVDVALVYWWVSFQFPTFWPVRVAAVLVTVYVALRLFGVPVDRWINSAVEGIFGAREQMPPIEATRWSLATSIPELAEVGIEYLEGRLTSQPAYAPKTPVDDETAQLIPVLVALNRAGFFTTGSQPGRVTGYEEAEPQNAYVIGFADEATMRSLAEHLADPRGTGYGLHFRIRQTRMRRDHAGRGRIRWGIESPSDVRSFYGEVCSPDAVDALLVGYQIVIEDRQAGRDDRIWPSLHAWANAQTEAATR